MEVRVLPPGFPTDWRVMILKAMQTEQLINRIEKHLYDGSYDYLSLNDPDLQLLIDCIRELQNELLVRGENDGE
jgi:hypothetical protein